ncbi:MAG: protoheme IX farnesyltransferase [Deltaproteobacteria bacterium]|nr:protoheme IX farnesyltransferase [Deltaproteobacteria bacterium]
MVRGTHWKTTLAEHLLLVKPGIVALVLLATLAGAYIGASGAPGGIFWTLAGVGLATAGAATLNNYVDRDIDGVMDRTSARALVTGSVSPDAALAGGLALTVSGLAALAVKVNLLSASLTGASVLIYVVLYGMILKRRSPMANQIGGIAGALPPVIGYAAVTGGLGIEAFAMFAIVCLWQQPHALCLALRYKDDYASASIPVVPVAFGVAATKLRILLYTIVLVPVSFMPYAIGAAGMRYAIAAFAAGCVYLILTIRFYRSQRDSDTFLFIYSMIYLATLFSLMVCDLRIAAMFG